MEIKDSKRFRIVLIITSLLAILFQLIGFFTQGWLLLRIKGSDFKLETDIGLWQMDYCYHSDEIEACHGMSFEEVAEHIIVSDGAEKAGADFLIGEVNKAKALATIAGLAAILGLFSTIAICISRFLCQIQYRRLFCCLSWIASAVFLLSAIICMAQLNTFLSFDYENSGLNHEVHFPWSLLLSGFGMLFSSIPGAMVGFLMCFDENLSRNGRDYEDEAGEKMANFKPSSNIFM